MSGRTLAIVAVVVALALAAWLGLRGACEPVAGTPIELPNGPLVPRIGQVEAALMEQLGDPTSPAVEAILQLTRLPTRTERAELAARGVLLGTHLGSHAYYATLPAGIDPTDLPLFQWAGVGAPKFKVAPSVWNAAQAPPTGRATLSVVVVVEPGTPRDVAKKQLGTYGTNLRPHGVDSWRMDVEPHTVEALAADPLVQRIDAGP